MKAYIITIIGAALLSAMAEILSPEKWRGYINIVTGLVTISCILSPVFTTIHSDIFRGLDASFEAAAEGADLHTDIIKTELEARINNDIEARMKNEYNLSVTAQCSIQINGEGAVQGVERIILYGDKPSAAAINRLCEVYGITYNEVRYE